MLAESSRRPFGEHNTLWTGPDKHAYVWTCDHICECTLTETYACQLYIWTGIRMHVCAHTQTGSIHSHKAGHSTPHLHGLEAPQ